MVETPPAERLYKRGNCFVFVTVFGRYSIYFDYWAGALA
jgi:hypothetical protein